MSVGFEKKDLGRGRRDVGGRKEQLDANGRTKKGAKKIVPTIPLHGACQPAIAVTS